MVRPIASGVNASARRVHPKTVGGLAKAGPDDSGAMHPAATLSGLPVPLFWATPCAHWH